MFESFAILLAEKLLVPFASWSVSKLGRAAPGWLTRLKTFLRRKQLQSQVTGDEVEILRFLSGTQWNYGRIQELMSGRLEGDELLASVTKLEALGLLEQPRLNQPPHPDALMSNGWEASLAIPAPRPAVQLRRHKRQVPEVVDRRKRLAGNLDWLGVHQEFVSRSGFVGEDAAHEAEARRRQLAEDEAWLHSHGY